MDPGNPIDPILPFLTYLNQITPLTAEDEKIVKGLVKVETFRKGEYLLEEGQISKAFYFNLSGFIRLFYLQGGEEKTAYFYPEGVFVSAYASFVRQTPSTFFLQAVEQTDVVVITQEASVKILQYSSKFEALARVAMEEELISHQEIIASLLMLRPEERYLDLLKNNPEIFQRVPQIQIASFIGVKPESLSRIKKRHLRKS